MGISIRRVYEPPQQTDGYRVLVDRLWPRGLRTADAHADLWMRGIAPSTELRTWFAHDPAKWDAFRERYVAELARHPDLLELLGDIERHRGRLTLLYGARDEAHNEARVLADVLSERRRATVRGR